MDLSVEPEEEISEFEPRNQPGEGAPAVWKGKYRICRGTR